MKTLSPGIIDELVTLAGHRKKIELAIKELKGEVQPAALPIRSVVDMHACNIDFRL